MITLHYVGPAKSGIAAKIGYYATRFGQRNYGKIARTITHTELFVGGRWNSASIASSSIPDKGVRVKHYVSLNPKHWIALELKGRNVDQAHAWFVHNKGCGYDLFGAMGSVVPALIRHHPAKRFCSEAVAESDGLPDAHTLNPAAFYNMQLALGARDITAAFFDGAP